MPRSTARRSPIAPLALAAAAVLALTAAAPPRNTNLAGDYD